MNCPECGTFNPDDRQKCWRCDADLPTPKPAKKRNPQRSAQIWLYIAIAIFAVVTILQTCGVSVPGMPSGPSPEGLLPWLPNALASLASSVPLF